jgi:hypothetical protein
MNKKKTITPRKVPKEKKINDILWYDRKNAKIIASNKKATYIVAADKAAEAADAAYDLVWDAVHHVGMELNDRTNSGMNKTREFSYKYADRAVECSCHDHYYILNAAYHEFVDASLAVDRKVPKSKYLGSFNNPRVAALVYDFYATKEFGEDAETNRSLGLLK